MANQDIESVFKTLLENQEAGSALKQLLFVPTRYCSKKFITYRIIPSNTSKQPLSYVQVI